MSFQTKTFVFCFAFIFLVCSSSSALFDEVEEQNKLNYLGREIITQIESAVDKCQDLSLLKEDSPLLRSIIYNQSTNNLLKKCLQKKANPNIADSSNGSSPLYYAVLWNNREAVDMLLKAGANTNIVVHRQVFSHFQSPLGRACEEKNDEIVKLLLIYGASAALEDEKADPLKTAIRYCAIDKYNRKQEQRNKIIKMLLAHGAQKEFDLRNKPKILVLMKSHFYKHNRTMFEDDISSYKKTARLIQNYLTIMYLVQKKISCINQNLSKEVVKGITLHIMQYDAHSEI